MGQYPFRRLQADLAKLISSLQRKAGCRRNQNWRGGWESRGPRCARPCALLKARG